MNGFRARFYKPALVLLLVALLVLVFFSQRELNRDRTKLGLTRVTPLENAPPVLAFTTVALGGFRGLIANALWIRATELQDEGKYFEMVQLADWITKLEPHFVSVWVHLAWNMAYNISVKFKDASDRWLWVQRGIELLRDDGLRFNPQEPLIYRELAWFFQHKMGADLDDAHFYYKRAWADQMGELFPNGRPDYVELLEVKSEQTSAQRKTLVEKYKLDPKHMKQVDETYGPLDWRLPEAHAIYWAMLGLEKGANKKQDLITLRRVIYQSMQLAFQRGRLITLHGTLKHQRRFDLQPNLDMIPRANAAYETMMEQDAEMREHIKTGHRNFLRDASYFLYTHNRLSEAAKWYRYLGEKYPDKPILDYQEESLPGKLTLDEYAVGRVTGDVGETSRAKTMANLEALFGRSYYAMALGEDDQAIGYERMAQQIWQRYQEKTSSPGQADRVGLLPLGEIKKSVRDQILDPESGVDPVLQDQLRTRLGLPPPTVPSQAAR